MCLIVPQHLLPVSSSFTVSVTILLPGVSLALRFFSNIVIANIFQFDTVCGACWDISVTLSFFWRKLWNHSKFANKVQTFTQLLNPSLTRDQEMHGIEKLSGLLTSWSVLGSSYFCKIIKLQMHSWNVDLTLERKCSSILLSDAILSDTNSFFNLLLLLIFKC